MKNDSFRNLRKLKSLYLYSNQIESIPDNAFEDLVQLEELSLRKINPINFY